MLVPSQIVKYSSHGKCNDEGGEVRGEGGYPACIQEDAGATGAIRVGRLGRVHMHRSAQQAASARSKPALVYRILKNNLLNHESDEDM